MTTRFVAISSVFFVASAAAASTVVVAPKTGQTVEPGQKIRVVVQTDRPVTEVDIIGQCLGGFGGQASRVSNGRWVWVGDVTAEFENRMICRIQAMTNSDRSAWVTLVPRRASQIVALIPEKEVEDGVIVEGRTVLQCEIETVEILGAINGGQARVNVTYDEALNVDSSDPAVVKYLGEGRIVGLKPGIAKLVFRYIQPNVRDLTLEEQVTVRPSKKTACQNVSDDSRPVGGLSAGNNHGGKVY
jgi:hypothetical protein